MGPSSAIAFTEAMGLTLEGESYMGSGHSLRYEARALPTPGPAPRRAGEGPWVDGFGGFDGSMGGPG